MTKPDDIPQDIWDAAIKSVRSAWRRKSNAAEGCARAIMAEREACALVAENYFSGNPFPTTSGAIAAAIRNRGAA